MGGICLTQWAAWTGGRWIGTPPDEARGVTQDTRRLAAGEVYLALRGPRHDGHAFLAAAAAAGCAAATVDETWAAGGGAAPVPCLVVPDTRLALVDLARGHRAALPLRVATVTGSVGKTTTKELLADMLAYAGPTARTAGNWNNDIGLPLSLLAASVTDRFGVFEVGTNHPGEIAPLCRLAAAECAIVTAVAAAHLEHFGSEEAIAVEKAAAFAALPSDGLAVTSLDSPWIEALAARAPCPVCTTSLRREEADYAGVWSGGTTLHIRERATGEADLFELPEVGEYLRHNVLLAVAAARRFGVSWPAIRQAVRLFRPPALRWEKREFDGITFILDAYNANPASMRAALQALGETPTAGGRWLVLGGMHELGLGERDAHRALGRDLASGPWAGLVAVGPRGAWVAEGAAEAGLSPGCIRRVLDAREAAVVLAARARPGDTVLVKASRAEELETVLTWWRAGRPEEILSP